MHVNLSYLRESSAAVNDLLLTVCIMMMHPSMHLFHPHAAMYQYWLNNGQGTFVETFCNWGETQIL